LIKKRFECLAASENAYSEAQHLLESELGLDKLKFKKPVGYTARFSDTFTNGRFDADYYHPQFDAIRQTVTNYHKGYEPLIHIATPIKPNIDPSKTPNHPYNYIELSNINPSLGTVDGFESKSGKDLPSRARRQVQYGDIIASSVVGSVDKAALIDLDKNGYIASTGFFHFRPVNVSPECLLILVRSKCVCMQFQQQATGGILSAVPDARLKHIIIPKLPQNLQQKITNLVIQSHKAKKKAQELLDQAKTRVEQLIEEASECGRRKAENKNKHRGGQSSSPSLHPSNNGKAIMPIPLPTPIYRLMHIDNLVTVLGHGGIHAPNHPPEGGHDYRAIHNVDIQKIRRTRPIPCGPGGTVHDYLAFYFGPRSPMLLQLHTGRVENYDEGQAPLIYAV